MSPGNHTLTGNALSLFTRKLNAATHAGIGAQFADAAILAYYPGEPGQ